MVRSLLLLLILLPLPFCSFASKRPIFFLATVVLPFVLPFFASIVGIALAIVVDHKVVLVQTRADNLFVPFLVDFIVYAGLFFNLVRFES